MAELDSQQRELLSREIPRLYFNGFAIGMSPVDITLRLVQNADPLVELSFTIPVAKQLVKTLGEVIEQSEQLEPTKFQKFGLQSKGD